MDHFRLARRHLLLGLAPTFFGFGCGLGEKASEAEELVLEPQRTSAAAINDALAQGQVVRILEGTLLLAEPLRIPSGGRLYGAGRELTRLVPTWAVEADEEDSPSNAMVLVVGSIVQSSATTLAANATKGSRRLSLEGDPGLAPGAWIRLRGGNDRGDELDMSDGLAVVLQELVRVLTNGTELELDVETAQHHGPGVAVDVVEPVEDAHVEGFELVGSGSGVAVALLVENAFEVTLRDLSGGGFSRTITELRGGTRQVRIDDVLSLGENNAIVLADSAIDVSITNTDSSPSGARSHASGVPRGLLSFRNRCSSIQVAGAVLQNACVGLRTWGGQGIHFSDIIVRDMDGTEVCRRDPEIREGYMGVGVDGGAGPLAIAEFGIDISFSSVHVEDCRHATLAQGAWYLHDIWNATLSGCSIVNRGELPTAAPFNCGLVASDCSGVIDNLVIQGVDLPFRTQGGVAALDVGTLAINGSSGVGHAGALAILFDHSGGSGTGPRIRKLTVNNTAGHTRFGPNFVKNSDWDLRIDDLEGNTWGTDLVVARNESGVTFSFGDVVSIDGVGNARNVATPEGPSTSNAVVVTGWPNDSGYGFMMISRLPAVRARVMATSAAVAYGDTIVADGPSRRAKSDLDPENPYLVIGRATSSKAAGAEGWIEIGPA